MFADAFGASYQVRHKGSPELYFIVSGRHGRQILTQAKVRKRSECTDCGAPIAVGEKAWKEGTQCAANRSLRWCLPCVERDGAR